MRHEARERRIITNVERKTVRVPVSIPARVFFKPAEQQREADKGLLHKCIDPAVARFKNEPEERQVDFRHQLGTYLRLYAFLGQIVNYGDPDLEKLYAFGRLLITKLKIDDGNEPLFIDDDVRLAYYRLTKTHEGSASLRAGETATVGGPTDVGTGRAREEVTARLSHIVDVLNERFGTDFTKEDQLFFDQVMGDLKQDGELGDQARSNSLDQFKLAFDPKGLAAVLARMDATSTSRTSSCRTNNTGLWHRNSWRSRFTNIFRKTSHRCKRHSLMKRSEPMYPQCFT